MTRNEFITNAALHLYATGSFSPEDAVQNAKRLAKVLEEKDVAPWVEVRLAS